MSKMLILLLILIPLSSNLYSISNDLVWIHEYGDINSDGFQSGQQTSDGGFILTGQTWLNGAKDVDIYVVKTDSEGNQVWSNHYGGSSWEFGYSIDETADQGFIITGYTSSYGHGLKDIWLLKIDSLGNYQWDVSLGGADNDIGRKVFQCISGDYLIIGYTQSFGNNYQMYIIRTNGNGDTLWTRILGGSAGEYGMAGLELNDQNIIVAGTSGTYGGGGNNNFYLIKLDPSGNEIWSQYSNNANCEYAYDIKSTSDGGFVITGHGDIHGADVSNVLLQKIDSTGGSVWSVNTGQSIYYDWGKSVEVCSDQGILVNGSTKSSQLNLNQIYLVKYDSAGQQLWTKVIDDTVHLWGKQVIETNCGYAVLGNKIEYNSKSTNGFLMMISKLRSNFDQDRTSGIAPVTVSFGDLSEGAINGWAWDFDGDGIIDSNDQNPCWIYSVPGIYTVSLIVSDGVNEDTLVKDSLIEVFDEESCLQFDGSSSYVSIDTQQCLNLTSEMTLEAWIYPQGWGENQNLGWGRIIDKSNYSLYVVREGAGYNQHCLAAKIIHQDSTVSYSFTDDSSLSLNRWQHVAVTYQGSTSEIKFYINGNPVSCSYLVPPSGNIDLSENYNLYLGNSSTGSLTFDGCIDEVRIWNVIRTSNEIMNSLGDTLTGSEYGLVGYWKMNEGFGDTIFNNTTNYIYGLVYQCQWAQGTPFISTGVEEFPENGFDRSFNLSFLHRNISGERIMVEYYLPSKGIVELNVYDVVGRKVENIIAANQLAGLHQVNISADQYSSGIYFIRLSFGSMNHCQKFQIIR